MKVFEYLLHYNLGYTVQIKRKGLVIKLGIYNNKGYYDKYSYTSTLYLTNRPKATLHLLPALACTIYNQNLIRP